MASRSQNEIMHLLSSGLPKHELVTALQSLLGISKPTAYKYLSQDVPIDYDHIIKILEYPPFQRVLYQGGETGQSNIVWNYPVFDRPVTDALAYINSIHNFITLFSGNEVEINYTTYEIPLFYYLYYPRLFAFKLYCWSKTIWKTPGFENVKFNYDDIMTPEVLDVAEATLQRFSELRSTEYWTDQLFDNTIRQLQYFRDMEYFDNMKDVRNIARDIHSLIGLMKVMASSGKKYNASRSGFAADITIYRNDIYFTNNIVSVHAPKQIITFCAFDNPNFIITLDPKLGIRTAEWLENMQSGCTRLTQNNDLVRLTFFRTMEEKLSMLGFDFE